jgi:predicted RNA-binding protein with TRAM domain
MARLTEIADNGSGEARYSLRHVVYTPDGT